MEKSGYKLILVEFCFVLLYHVFFSFRSSFLSIVLTFENYWSIDILLQPWFTRLSLSSCKWYSKSIVFEQTSLILKACLYGILVFKGLGCSELMLSNVRRSVCFLYIFVFNLLFFMYTSVSRNVMLVFDIWYSNLMDLCFVLSSFKKFIRSFPAGNYMFRVNNKNTRTRCEICFFI